MGLHLHNAKPADVKFYEGYFAKLVGATIEDVKMLEDDGEYWPTFAARFPNGDTVQFEIHQDEEGNGPGWVAGLDNEESYTRA